MCASTKTTRAWRPVNLAAAVVTASCGLAIWGSTARGAVRPPPQPPPPNPAIVFNNGSGSIYVMNADGSNAALVLAGAGDGMVDPVFSPDGSKIAFIGSPFGTASLGLYTINTNGTGLTLLTPTGQRWVGCAWSPVAAPDGRFKIAFIDYPVGSGVLDVFLINADGTGRAPLTFTPAAGESHLAWSPDASRLVVAHIQGRADCLVYDLGVDGWGQVVTTGVTNITEVPGSPLAGRPLGDIQAPDWARTSDRIALVANGPVGDDVWTIDPADPAHPVNITGGIDSKNDGYPSWSPDDGKLVVFRSGNGPNTGLCTINASGGGLKVIRKTGIRPDWKREP